MSTPTPNRVASPDRVGSLQPLGWMPPEWAPHAATWLAWPHNPDTWPGLLAEAQDEFEGLVRTLAAFETVHLLVRDEAIERDVRRRLPAELRADRLVLHRHETCDGWMRDIGPTFVRDAAGGLVAIDWVFNAWGAKYERWQRDDAVAARVAEWAGVRRHRSTLCAEGGALEVDGEGTLLANERTLVDERRNPGLDRAAIEAILAHHLGIERVIWIVGGVVGDDTDGHIDDVARFVAPGRVACAREPNADDENHALLERCRARLVGAVDARGRTLELVDLPMPPAIHNRDERLPASYANFYIANGAVLVPVFGEPTDARALGILSSLFPGREVVGVLSRALVSGLGSIHCLSQQQPLR